MSNDEVVASYVPRGTCLIHNKQNNGTIYEKLAAKCHFESKRDSIQQHQKQQWWQIKTAVVETRNKWQRLGTTMAKTRNNSQLGSFEVTDFNTLRFLPFFGFFFSYFFL